MTLGAVKMMRFLYDNSRKLISKGGISDTDVDCQVKLTHFFI